MSTILVIGAKGRVGVTLVKVLQESAHRVLAASRHGDRHADWDERVEAVVFNLEGSVEEMAQVFSENAVDVIIFTAGSRGKNLLQIDLHGAIKTMQAAEKSGAKRYIMLSGSFSLQPEKWEEFNFDSLKDYYIAKHYADVYLKNNTSLYFTILGPGSLVESDTSTGKIEVQPEQPGANTIGNVALTLASLVNAPATIGKVINMRDGEVPIQNALTKEYLG